MEITRKILRIAFGTVTALYAITLLFSIFNQDNQVLGLSMMLGYLTMYAVFLIHIPAFLTLLAVSIYSYIMKRGFWSVYGNEYCYLFVTLTPIIIARLFFVAIP